MLAPGQVSIQTPCCKRWYECPECHDERENHPQRISAKNVVSIANIVQCYESAKRIEHVLETSTMHRKEWLSRKIACGLQGGEYWELYMVSKYTV